MLRAAFRWAVAEELIERDPTDLVKPPAYRKPEARYLDLEDVRRLRELVAGHALEGAAILGLSGLRAAEACFVRWGDLADNVLHVRGSSWGATKSGRTRSLTLPAGEVAALRTFKTREAERLLAVGVRIDDRTTILTDGVGEPVGSKYLGQTFTIWARARGLDCTYHSLRHTAASLMLASGTDVRTVAGRLGHASATTTLQTYSHLIGQADRDAAERLDVLLGPS
jgi:integrase